MSTSPRARLLRLRRGTQVHARGDGLLQVGSDPGRRALVPDTAAVRGLLHLLDHGVRSDATDGLPRLCAALHRAGVLIAPDELDLLAQARACTRVELDLPASWASVAADLLAVAGLATAPVASSTVLLRAWSPHSPALPPSPETPVLHLRAVDARVRLGPFVETGSTACPECVEAHLRETDPWRRTGTPEVQASEGTEEVDPLLLHAVLTSAVFDLVAWAEGRQPLTWSATRWFDGAQQVEHHVWPPHPHCGCAWEEGWPRADAG